jgi:hypothetical protein
MKPNIFIRYSNFLRRDLIKKDEGKLTYVQLFGFLLIILGIVYFASFLLPSGIIDILPFLKLDEHPESSEVPIAFFTIMLGVAFAFPDMLKGQTKEISTMRIIVFMFANVMCMLILKIGWDKHSLGEIGLDGYWMGIIAFLFGAKATQSYFENAKSLLPSNQQPSKSNEQIQISKIAIAQIAKVQNEEKLHEQFPSIEFASDTLKDGESCLTLYLTDHNIKGIPSFVNAQINETTIVKVQTEIITNIGEGKPHLAQLTNNIADTNTPHFLGSICCLVESTVNSNTKGVLTSGHVFTNGKFIDFDGFVNSNQAFDSLSNGNSIGELYFQQMIPSQDLAVVKINSTTTIHNELMKFPKGFYNVSQSDLNSPTKNVTILSKDSNQRDAFIIDINVSMRLYYVGTQKIMRNIILIGSDTDKNHSTTVSVGGDSGSCVYHKESKQIIGMLLGGNDKFSFVLPFEQTLKDNNFKIK